MYTIPIKYKEAPIGTTINNSLEMNNNDVFGI